jgi:PhnB protein
MSTDHRPAGFSTVTPYLICARAEALIPFLQAAFGAEVALRMDAPGGGIMHAELRIGGSPVELSSGSPVWPSREAALHLYVPDADETYRRALDAGATSLYEPADRPYGDREAGVVDPAGNHWFIATHREDVSVEEMSRRMAEGGA